MINADISGKILGNQSVQIAAQTRMKLIGITSTNCTEIGLQVAKYRSRDGGAFNE